MNALGSLFVELRANTADFVNGMSKSSYAARRAGKEIEDSFSRLGGIASKVLAPLGEMGEHIASTLEKIGTSARGGIGSLGALGGVMAGVGAAAVGVGAGLFAAAEKAAEFGSKIYEAHEKTGLSSMALSGLAVNARLTHEDFDSLTTSLARASMNLEKTIEHGGKTNQILVEMMGGAKGMADQSGSLDDRLQRVLKSIFDLNDVGQRNLALNQLLGKGWQNNIETLKLLAEEGFGPAIQRAKELGLAFDEEGSRKAKEFTVEASKLKVELEGLSVAIGRDVMPSFSKFLVTLDNSGKAMKGLAADLAVLAAFASGPLALLIGKGAMEKDKAAWDSYRNGIANTNAEVKKLADGAKHAAEGTDRLAISTGKLAKEKPSFAELLANMHAALPNFLTLEKALDEISKSEWGAKISGQAKIFRDIALGELPKIEFKGLDVEGAGLPDVAVVKALSDEVMNAAGAYKGLSAEAQLYDVESRRIAANHPFEDTKKSLQDVQQELASAGKSTVLIQAAIQETGRRLTEQWDEAALRIGTLHDKLRALMNEIVLQGQDLGAKVFGSLLRSIDDVSTELARLVVTGKSNFKELFQSLEMSIVKAGIQDLFGRLAEIIKSKTSPQTSQTGPGAGVPRASGAGVGGVFADVLAKLGGKPSVQRGADAAHPLYVHEVGLPGGGGIPVTTGPGVGGAGGVGGSTGGPGGLSQIAGVFRSIADVVGGIFTKLSSALGSLISSIGEALRGGTVAGGSGGDNKALTEALSLLIRNLFSDIKKLFEKIWTSMAGVIGSLSSTVRTQAITILIQEIKGIMGGGMAGMAGGGDVVPGRAYIVGEHHPEFFVPSTPGHIHPTLDVSSTRHQPVTNVFNINGVSDFDSFKRSQSQTMAALLNQMSVALARNKK